MQNYEKDMKEQCNLCDNECGSAKLYANQHIMPLNGRVRCIDPCIADIKGDQYVDLSDSQWIALNEALS